MADTLDSFDEVTRPADRGSDVSLRVLPLVRGMAGTFIANRFEILDLVAEGGMGTVYRARDHELDDVVALKMLRSDVAGDGRGLDLFRQEVKLARRVTHRNVARIYELGEHEGRYFLTMEYIQGEPLSSTLRAHGRLSANLAVYVLGAVCEALDASHSVGVVHRDIKPSNVLIASDGRVVLTDFGLARSGFSVDTGLTVGTPAYMAPEQVRGGKVTPSTDVYALGAMAFELVTGNKPWSGSTPSEVAYARLDRPPPDPRSVVPTIPESIALAIMRCMESSPESRFGSMGDASKAFLSASPDTQVVPIAPGIHTTRLTPKQPLLAVLPADASTEDPRLLGLVEDLVDALSSVKALRVMARGSVRKATREGTDPVEVGKSLGARAVITVSKRQDEHDKGLSVRLIQVSDGVQLWAGRYGGEGGSVLGISDDVTKQIVEVLNFTQNLPSRNPSTDALVVDLYLRARHSYLRFNFEELGRAIDLYEQARARAPEDPLVCSGLAMALVRRWFWDFDGTREWSARARDAVETALRIAPWNGEPRLAQATLLLHSGEAARAARELRHAIACSPSLSEAHEQLGRMLNEAGYVEQAERRLDAALMLDPCSSIPVWERIRSAALAGDWDRFDRFMVEALGPDGKRTGRWTSHLRYAAWRKDPALLREIAEEFDRSRKDLRFNLGAVDAYVDVALRAGPFEAAKRAMEDRAFVDGASARRTTFYLQMQAELAGIARDKVECLHALTKADRHGLFDLAWLDHCPLLEIARSSEGFKAIRNNVLMRAESVYDALWSP
jgi:serine/threonine-protein kinase